ncbi:DUF1016 N-terminal domain-containing protein [Paraburkholderia sp. 32]|uniref:DUF1016 N-terminal domain-containing protein n=1 Tax=Paraburkholderia sp. 32 TaxID=2991057 RepID=UPI003D209840
MGSAPRCPSAGSWSRYISQIGREILERQRRQGRGAKVVDQLAPDLRAAFPDMRGFSPRNLKYMRTLAEAWPGEEFVQYPVTQLPWSRVVTLVDQLKGIKSARVVRRQIFRIRWSRNVLVMQIESRRQERRACLKS